MVDALPPAFFARDTLTVSRELLGQLLYSWDPEAGAYNILRVVETEAYTQDDPSCHAFRGPKGRAATLFKQPGLAYVYFIYGMYYCLNVVTEPEGQAGAVLFRALEPLAVPGGGTLKTHGPGRLCKALGITRDTHNELPMTEDNGLLFLAPGEHVPADQVITTTRIGISVAEHYPWRFYVKDSPYVSVRDKAQHPPVPRRSRKPSAPEVPNF